MGVTDVESTIGVGRWSTGGGGGVGGGGAEWEALDDTGRSYLVAGRFQRVLAAFLAISLRFLADNFAALAAPPFLPKATAAGSFPLSTGMF